MSSKKNKTVYWKVNYVRKNSYVITGEYKYKNKFKPVHWTEIIYLRVSYIDGIEAVRAHALDYSFIYATKKQAQQALKILRADIAKYKAESHYNNLKIQKVRVE